MRSQSHFSECDRPFPREERSNSRLCVKWHGPRCAEACLRLALSKRLCVHTYRWCCQAPRTPRPRRQQGVPPSETSLRQRMITCRSWHLRPKCPQETSGATKKSLRARGALQESSRSEHLHCHHPLHRHFLRSMPRRLPGGVPSCVSGRLPQRARAAPTLQPQRTARIVQRRRAGANSFAGCAGGCAGRRPCLT